MSEIEMTKETLKHFGLDKNVLEDHYMGYTEQIKNIGIAITRHIKKGKGKAIIYFDPDFPRYLIKYENDVLRKNESTVASFEKCRNESFINFFTGEGCKAILEHYGLSFEDTKNVQTTGFDSECFNKMCEIIGNVWKINGRVRITLDYDPNYPKSIVRTEFFN